MKFIFNCSYNAFPHYAKWLPEKICMINKFSDKKKSIKSSVKFFPSLQKMNRGSENTLRFDLNIGWWDSTFWFLFSSLGFLFVCLFIGLRGFTFLLVKLKSLSHVWLFATLWTVPTRLLCPWESPGRNTGVGCRFLLQGNFPTQGSNPGLPHCEQTL